MSKSNKLKLKILLGEYVSRISAFGNYWILKFHDPIQNTFTPMPQMSLMRKTLNCFFTATTLQSWTRSL